MQLVDIDAIGGFNLIVKTKKHDRLIKDHA